MGNGDQIHILTADINWRVASPCPFFYKTNYHDRGFLTEPHLIFRIYTIKKGELYYQTLISSELELYGSQKFSVPSLCSRLARLKKKLSKILSFCKKRKKTYTRLPYYSFLFFMCGMQLLQAFIGASYFTSACSFCLVACCCWIHADPRYSLFRNILKANSSPGSWMVIRAA